MTNNLSQEPDETVKSCKPRFKTPTYSTGRCLVPNLDNTSELLAFLDGEIPSPDEPADG